MPKNKTHKGRKGPADDGDENDGESQFTTDKFGNTITKQEAKEREDAERMRAAAKARRRAKAQAKGEDPATENANDVTTSGNGSRPQWLQDYDKAKAKQDAGKKLSGKEKKLLKRGEARREEDKALGITYGDENGDEDDAAMTELLKRLEGFSLALMPTRNGDGDGNGHAAATGNKDAILRGITISAPHKPLLVNADLTLSHGRRYGLIGANGRGKSTLLRFLAARRLPIPSTMDVLLVEQEASASARRSVLEEVLSADARRENKKSWRP